MNRIVAAAVIGVLATVTTGAGQQGAPPQQPPLRSNANFVHVDVYPTADGKPVMDLRADDFEVAEDGAVQTIESFDHVDVTPAGPQALRADPSTIEQSRQLAADPRNRVFVIFLDRAHVQPDSARRIQEPLIRLIDRVLGPDDLVGIITPGMPPASMVLARKTQVLEAGLRRPWPWGERFSLDKDEGDRRYDTCYPPMPQERYGGQTESPIAAEMSERRHERDTLDALNDLVRYLRGFRDARTAVLTISEGWKLFQENPKLTELRTNPVTGIQEAMPGVDPVTVGPDGKLTTKNVRDSSAVSSAECDTDRMTLAALDDVQYLREIIGDANRSSVSFYTVDPRGIAPFDTPIGPARPPSPLADAQALRRRQGSLQTLAAGTDGVAIIQNNDLDAGLKRIAGDLTSYYLLGYYSTNRRLDGKFRSIKVIVKRPGIEVRARNGYRAATEAEMMSTRTAAPIVEPVAGLAAAFGALARIRPDARFVVNAVPVGNAASITAVWVAGELQSVAASDPLLAGSTVDLDVTVGGTTTTSRITIAPGQRAFAAPVVLSAPAAFGTVDVRARLSATAADAGHLADRVRVDASPDQATPMMFRRGPSTGNRMLPAASAQVSRTERARLEFAVDAGVTARAARLLGQAGQPLAVPVTLGERVDTATGQRWLTADVAFAALGAGDYAIEVVVASAGGERRWLTAIRVAR